MMRVRTRFSAESRARGGIKRKLRTRVRFIGGQRAGTAHQVTAVTEKLISEPTRRVAAFAVDPNRNIAEPRGFTTLVFQTVARPQAENF